MGVGGTEQLSWAGGCYITAKGNRVEYSTLMQTSVMLLNELPTTLTNPNFFCMSRKMPVEKHSSSFHTYSLNVAPHQWPIFCIFVSEWPERAKTLAPPLQSEWVMIHLIGMTLRIGYSSTVAAVFVGFLWQIRSFR
jgi:hypothetical protein